MNAIYMTKRCENQQQAVLFNFHFKRKHWLRLTVSPIRKPFFGTLGNQNFKLLVL